MYQCGRATLTIRINAENVILDSKQLGAIKYRISKPVAHTHQRF